MNQPPHNKSMDVRAKQLLCYPRCPLPSTLTLAVSAHVISTVGRFSENAARQNFRTMIPEFRYHPNPISTGNIQPSDTVCLCCGKNRGYIYTASIYARENLRDAICPFCIADGSAAEKFNAIFSDDYPLYKAGISEQIVDEVTRRTPGYISWQQEVWLTCCEDACEFHGDAPKSELRELDGETLEQFLSEIEWSASEWKEFVPHYEAGGNPAVYKFVCRHCKRPRYGMDFT